MERTRFFRRPVVWIILVIIGAIALSSFFTSGPSYQRVDTSIALERLNQPGITKAVVKDKEQTLQLDLAAPEAVYPGDQDADQEGPGALRRPTTAWNVRVSSAARWSGSFW